MRLRQGREVQLPNLQRGHQMRLRLQPDTAELPQPTEELTMTGRTDDEYNKALNGPADPKHIAAFDQAEQDAQRGTVVERSEMAAKQEKNRRADRRWRGGSS